MDSDTSADTEGEVKRVWDDPQGSSSISDDASGALESHSMDVPFDRIQFMETSPYGPGPEGLARYYRLQSATSACVRVVTSACVRGVMSDPGGCAEWGAGGKGKRKRAPGAPIGHVLTQRHSDVSPGKSGVTCNGSADVPCERVSLAIHSHLPLGTHPDEVNSANPGLTELVVAHVQGLIEKQGDGLALDSTPLQLASLQLQNSEMRAALTFLNLLATDGSEQTRVKGRVKPSATGLRRSLSEAESITNGGTTLHGALLPGGFEVTSADVLLGRETRGRGALKRNRFGGLVGTETLLSCEGGVPLDHEATGLRKAAGELTWGESRDVTASFGWQSSDSTLQSGQHDGGFVSYPELPRVGPGFPGPEDEWWDLFVEA